MKTASKKLFLVPVVVLAFAVVAALQNQAQAADKTCEIVIGSNAVVTDGTKENDSHQLRLTSFHEPSNDIWGVLFSYQGNGKFTNDSTFTPDTYFFQPVNLDNFTISLKKERTLVVSYPKAGSCEISTMVDAVVDTKAEVTSSPIPAASHHTATYQVPQNFQARASFTDQEGYHEVLFVSYDNNPQDRGVMIYSQIGNARDYDSSHQPEKLLKEPKDYVGITVGMEDSDTFFLRYPDNGTCNVERSH